MQLPNKLVILFFLGTLVGCATSPYQSSKYKSQALNVTNAAGAEWLRDMSQNDFDAQADKTIKRQGNQDGLGTFAANTLLFGWSTSVPLWSVGNKANKELYPALIFWMPKSLAKTREDAANKYNSLLEKAIDETLLEVNWPDGITVTREGQQRVSRWENLYGHTSGEHKGLLPLGLAPKFVRRTSAPDFLGGGEAWTGQSKGSMGVSIGEKGEIYSTDTGQFKPISPVYEFYQKLSEHLPAWAFIYLPGKDARGGISMRGTEGFRFLPVPVVLNQGKEHFFVEPN